MSDEALREKLENFIQNHPRLKNDNLQYIVNRLKQHSQSTADVMIDVPDSAHHISAPKISALTSIALACTKHAYRDEHFDFKEWDGRHGILRKILETRRFDPNYPCQGRTPLSYAVEEDDPELVHILLEFGAQAGSTDEEGRTPLWWLLHSKNVSGESGESILELLLLALKDHTAIVNLKDSTGYTALMLAVEKDNFHAARKLLELPGIDCNVTNGSGRTAMTLAAREGSLPLVELLHRRKAAVNKADKNGDTPLVWAIRELHFDIVKYLLDNAGATTDQKNTGGQTPLHIAAETGELEMFHTVLMAVHGRSSESDLCLNNEGRTCYSLFIEARKRNSRAGFGSPYYEQYKFSEILSKLSDIDVFDGGRSLLSWAAEYNDIVWLRALLGRGADRNQRDKMPPKGSRPSIRRTPVIWALEKDNLEAATLLATHDISVLSLVQEAKKRQESVPEACRLLQKLLPCLKDESLNRIDDEGKTALHYAAELPGSEITKLLTDHGISIDGLDNDSKTALQLAVENKKLENVTALLRRGAAFPEIPLNIWQELDPTGARRCVRFTRTGLDGLELAFLAGSEARDWNTRPTSSSLLLCDPQSLSVQMENAPIHPTVPGRTLNDIITSTTYVRYQRASGPDTTVNRLSVFFPPAKQSYRKKAQLLRPETLAMEWAVTSSETENKAFYTYISALPQELPATPASFCKQLILNLRQKWEIRAQYVRDHIAELRQSQIRRKGRNQTIINHLAQHSELRGTLREYLSGHVQGLQTMITAQKKFPGSEKQELFEAVHCLDQTIKSQLDDSERAAQEVLQLELAWVSISEAASVKRLSWMTIIFLPLMFSSSLFGMNIDLLKDNPDWTWYLVFSAVSVLITICLWTLLKYIPIETWRKSDLIARNKFSDHNVSLETGKSG